MSKNRELIILNPKYVKIQEQISNGETVLVSVIKAYGGIEVKIHLFQPLH
jgi:hypothetical protein